MTTIELLQQQKAALDFKIAEAIRLEQARQRAHDLQLMKEREAEIIKGTEEIQALMKKYKLTQKDIFNEGKPRSPVPLPDAAGTGDAPRKKTLQEMRQFFN